MSDSHLVSQRVPSALKDVSRSSKLKGAAQPHYSMTMILPEPVKSPQDKRLYRRIRLANELDVLLIEDPDMERSSIKDDDASSMASSEADSSQEEVRHH